MMVGLAVVALAYSLLQRLVFAKTSNCWGLGVCSLDPATAANSRGLLSCFHLTLVMPWLQLVALVAYAALHAM